MKVLVTGYDGYVGSVLVGVLASAGHEVRGLDARFFGECGVGPQATDPHQVTRADIRRMGPPDLRGIDAIVHLAALSNDPLGDLREALTYDINHHASVRLACSAVEAGVQRFVFASSCSLYGVAGEDVVTEDAPVRAITAYGHSKVRTEKDLSEMASESFSPTFLRSATAYGWSHRLRMDVVVNNLVGSAVTRGVVRLTSSGRSWRPLIHVEDLCRAFLAVLEAPRSSVHGRAFNVVPDGENYLIRDLAEIVAGVVPGSKVTYAEESGNDPRSYRVDGSLLLDTVPTFRPKWTVEAGVRQLYAMLSETGLSEGKLFGPDFIRLKKIRQLLDQGRIDRDLFWTNRPGGVGGPSSSGLTSKGAEVLT